jgi:hypothetical protein
VVLRFASFVAFRGIVWKSLNDGAFLAAILSTQASGIDPLDQQTLAAS